MMPYTPKDWSDGPEGGTPILADDLDHLETQYAQAVADAAANNPQDGRVIVAGFAKTDVIAALDKAEAKGLGTVVYFPAGTYDVGVGLDLANRTCQIRGAGAYPADGVGTPHAGTVFRASSQTGPVLDFSDWRSPWYFQGKVVHSGFLVRGSGAADPTKNNAGIRVKAISSCRFTDIAIMDTGGPCLQGVPNSGNAQYFVDFDEITLNTPVAAAANDVPWMIFSEANCCRFSRIGFRHIGSAAAVGPSGAMVIDSPATYASNTSKFDAFWFENMQVADTAAVVVVKGRKHVLTDFQFIDCFKMTGAANTAYFRFLVPPGTLQGGNELRGLIPGRDPDYVLSLDYGVDMQQSYNRVVGVKGRNGHNVQLGNTVNAHVEFGGTSYAAATAAVDQVGSASTSTVIIDGAGGARTQSGWSSLGTDGVIHPLSNLTGNTTLTTAMHTVVMNGVSLTVTLPDPTVVPRGRLWVVKNVNASAVTVVSAGTSKTIDGAASDTLAQWAAGRYISNGTNWNKV